jgi:8-oxo-dGTP diphosphatase
VNLRQGVRGLVVDSSERLVLVRFDFSGRTVWVTPGGGVELDESDEDALRRELREELGFELADPLGEPVWERTHGFAMTGWEGQTERFYLLRVEPFEITPALGWEALRAEGVHEIRWWTLDEIGAASDVVFAPRRLHDYLSRLLRSGAGPVAVDVGI